MAGPLVRGSIRVLTKTGVPGPPSGPAGGELGGTYPDPTVDDGADGSAIHDDVAGEIAAIVGKGSPLLADLLVLEDSAVGNAKKSVTVGDLVNAGDTRVAERIVGATNATDATIAAAIAALPAGGGRITLRAGTFSPATLPLTNKDIEFVGAGRGATIINIPTGAALFTSAFGRNRTFRNMTIAGNDSAGQVVFNQTVANSLGKRIRVDDVEITGIEKIFKCSSTFVMHVSFCRFLLVSPPPAAARLLDAGTGTAILHMYRTEVQNSAAISGTDPRLLAVKCEFDVANDMKAKNNKCVDCDFTGTGTVEMLGTSSFIGCDFSDSVAVVVKSSFASFIDCIFSSDAARHIDVESGFDKGVITGCRFLGFASEAVRLTDADEWEITAPNGCKVLEAGTSNKNRLWDITPDSTIVGPFTKVNGAYRRTTAPAAGDDIADGVSIDDRWVDETADEEYVNLDNTAVTAVWKKTTPVTEAINVYDNTGGQSFTTTPVTVNLDTTKTNTDAAHYSLATDEVTVKKAGTYKFEYEVALELLAGSNDDASSRIHLDEDSGGGFGEVDGSRAFGSHSNIESGDTPDHDTPSGSIVLVVAANNKYRLRAVRHSGDGTLSTVADGSRLTVTRLK